MILGYNTNGFAHHRLEDAIAILAEIGFRGVALTLDHGALNPYDPGMPEQRRRVERLLERYGLRCVIETGSRFLLDPWRKHSPTLLDEPASASPADPPPRESPPQEPLVQEPLVQEPLVQEPLVREPLVREPLVRESLLAPPPEAGILSRERRLDFLARAIDMAGALRADAVSFWSGAKPPGLSDEEAMNRLVDGCRRLLDLAERRGVRLAFEPEPGMFIDTMTRFDELHERLNHPFFGLTLDVGHVHCLNDGDIPRHIEQRKDRLFNVHIEDMRQGVHDHLAFGRGEIDFPPILAALGRIDYPYGVYVELSRHGHDAVNTARAAHAFLSRLNA